MAKHECTERCGHTIDLMDPVTYEIAQALAEGAAGHCTWKHREGPDKLATWAKAAAERALLKAGWTPPQQDQPPSSHAVAGRGLEPDQNEKRTNATPQAGTPVRIYISGAITGMDRDTARLRFNQTAQALYARGHEPVDPFDIPNGDCECPATLPDGVVEHTWPCCLRKDIRVLVDCDAILMLTANPELGYPGWESSHGARLELQVASAVGLRVYSSVFEIDVERARTPA